VLLVVLLTSGIPFEPSDPNPHFLLHLNAGCLFHNYLHSRAWKLVLNTKKSTLWLSSIQRNYMSSWNPMLPQFMNMGIRAWYLMLTQYYEHVRINVDSTMQERGTCSSKFQLQRPISSKISCHRPGDRWVRDQNSCTK